MKNSKNLRLYISNSEKVSQVPKEVTITDWKVIEEADNIPEKPTTVNEDETKKLPPVSFSKLYSYADKLEIFLMSIGILCSIGTGLCQPANILMFGDLVGSMVNAALQESVVAPAVSNDMDIDIDLSIIMDAVAIFTIGNCIIGIIMLTLSYVSITIFNYTAQRQVFRIRSMYLRSALHQDISWYDMTESGDVSSRLAEDITKFEEGIGEKCVMFSHNIVAFTGCVVLAFIKGWELALVCIVSLPITLVVLVLLSTVISRLSRNEIEKYAQAGSIAEEVLSSMRTVVAFGGQRTELIRYKSNLTHAYRNNTRKEFFSGLGFGLLWFFIYANYALSFWYGVTLILDERYLPANEQTYTVSIMITVFFSVMMGSMNIGTASPFIEAFGISKGAAANIFSVIERKSAINSLSSDGSKSDIYGSIEFKNICFEYPSRANVPILRHISFSIKKGETVALVGGSGCGKSTCIQLLQRFYDPSEGQILLDGHDLRNLNIEWFRSHMGVVGQEPVLFDTTVAENIRYGNSNASMEDITCAAKKANAHDFIMKLPYKYDTMVGERGAQISGGQKQRIAIARALVRNPKILLLDEATSALDVRSEAKVQAALDKASKGRTTIIVAHRLTTIRGANKIIVLSDGKVVEEGTHDYLMTLKGSYYSLVTSQISEFDESKSEDITFDHGKDKDDEDTESMAIVSEKLVDEVTDAARENVSMMKVLRYNKPEWPYILCGCLAAGVVGCSTPLFAILFGEIISVLSGPDPDEVRSETNMYCVYFVLAGIVIGLSTFVQIFLFGISGARLTMRLRGLAFEAMIRQEMAWFDDPKNGTGVLCSKLSAEAASVQGATGQRIGTLIQSANSIILAVGLSIYYEWRLGLVGMTFIPFILVIMYLQGLMMTKETFSYHKSLEESTKIAVDAISNIRTVVGLGQEETFHKAYVNTMAFSFNLAKRNAHYRGIVFGFGRSITLFAYAACTYYGGYLIENDGLYYARVFKVAQALVMSTVMVANAMAFAPNFQKGLIAGGKIIALLERVPKVLDPKDVDEQKWNPDANVNYKGVTFNYPTRPEVQVLQALNLDVSSGQTIALIGPSGCGKSTIIQLLQRFYDPISGTIELSGRNISSVTQASLRMQLGLVSQEPALFARSIAENISYGDNTRVVTLTEIVAAAKKANVHDFISSLPLGYDTKLGDRGMQLSGGQKQRVAIARALIRNPKILLLDEATSALDMENEKIVQAALDEAKEGRTCITIAHRLSTIQDADRICVMDRGIIAESGTHEELIRKKGLYYKLLTLQISGRE